MTIRVFVTGKYYRNIMKQIYKKFFFVFFFLIISLFANLYVLSNHGIPFRYDWNWPVFTPNVVWRFLSSPDAGILNILTKNTSLLFATLGSVVYNTEFFLRIFLILITFISGCGAYVFISKQKVAESIKIIFGTIYALSPYIFIRVIVGFRWSLIAYALLPIFFHLYFNFRQKKIFHYAILGFLLSLIFAQIQAGLILSLVLFIYLLICIWQRKDIKGEIRSFMLTYLFFVLFDLPWLIYLRLYQHNLEAVSGSTVTTTGFISDMSHSFRNMLMLSDHHVTSSFFYSLSHNKLFLFGWIIIWFVAFCAIFNKANRQLVWTLIISSVLILPFIKGPLGLFGGFYLWFYNHVPQIAVFRETYHFELLYTISLCILFAFGLDWLWRMIGVLGNKVKNIKLNKPLKIGAKTLLAGSALFIIAPYFTLDFAGYLKLQRIPDEYYQLDDFLQENKGFCQKIYYPPGLGFVYFKGDDAPDASNTDIIAYSLGLPYLDVGASVLNLPSKEMFYRNEVVSQFYQESDNGEFALLLKEGKIDCVILKLDTDTKYHQASNLGKEKDRSIIKKWRNIDVKSLMESKKGFQLEKQFGSNILIFKPDQQYQLPSAKYQEEIMQSVGEKAAEKFRDLKFEQLPLAEWTTAAAYYKDGWSRGRYDFWRKHIFTQLRQDFIYTDKPDSQVTGKIEQKGSYELWVRYLTGGGPGELEIKIQNTSFMIQKEVGEEKFIWKDLGQIEISNSDILIKNISGENAIADIVLTTSPVK